MGAGRQLPLNALGHDLPDDLCIYVMTLILRLQCLMRQSAYDLDAVAKFLPNAISTYLKKLGRIARISALLPCYVTSNGSCMRIALLPEVEETAREQKMFVQSSGWNNFSHWKQLVL